jgi:hypothetical protein
VKFVHDGSGQVPAFTISITDPSGGSVGPFAANISFTGSGFVVTPPPTAASGSGGGVPTYVAAMPATTPSGTTEPGAAAYLRGPTEAPSGGGDTDDAPAVQPPTDAVTRASAGAVPQDKVLIPEGHLLGIRAESEVLETKPLRSEIQVEPMRGQLEVLPVGGEEPLDLEEEDRQVIEIVLNSVRITGLAMSVGAVWWAARAAGLLASLLTVTPAWRHVDPLPVLGRTDEEEEERDVNDETMSAEEKDRRDDEHRARWVLDERAGSA